MKFTDLLPKKIKLLLLNIYQYYLYNKVVKIVMDHIQQEKIPSDKILKKLIYGWGNVGFSAQTEYLKACMKHAYRSDFPILECGSGLSTVIVGAIAARKGVQVVALEHNDTWADKVQRELDRWNLNNVQIQLAPLQLIEGYQWYGFAKIQLPEEFGIIICDGPPKGRVALWPLMEDRIRTGTVILVDDIVQEEEREMILAWKKNATFQEEYHVTHDQYAVLTVVKKQPKIRSTEVE